MAASQSLVGVPAAAESTTRIALAVCCIEARLGTGATYAQQQAAAYRQRQSLADIPSEKGSLVEGPGQMTLPVQWHRYQ